MSRSAVRQSSCVDAHRARHALGRAEEVGEHRDRRGRRGRASALGRLEQQRGAARAQHAVAQRGHLEMRIDGAAHAPQLAARFELGHEVAQVAVGHRVVAGGRRDSSPCPRAEPPYNRAHDLAARRRAFLRTRRVVFGIVLASFVLSFFHRTAPAAISGELARTFAINATTLGTLAATYFYVYTVLQIPVGVLADTMGPRKLLAGGSLVAGIGSLAFALAPSWEVAAVGRTLVGIGVATAFIAILKARAVWFPPQRFATLNGVTMFAGNPGAVIAGAPLAWVVAQASWRTVFLALGALSLLLAVATWWRVRDRPEDLGFAAVQSGAACRGQRIVDEGAGDVMRNPATWPGFFVNAGIGGSYLAFAGLWAVPYLVEVTAFARDRRPARQPAAPRRGVRIARHRLALGPARQPSRGDARVHAALRAVVVAVAVARHVGRMGDAHVVLPDGIADPRLHAVVDGGQGGQPARALGNGNVRGEPRHLPRHRHPAAARWAPCSIAAARQVRAWQAWDHALWIMAGAAAFGAACAWLVRGKPATPKA